MIAADAWAVADPTVCEICGRDSCEDHLPPEPSKRAPRPRLMAVRAQDVIASPAPEEIIEGIAWAGCLTVLVAESGAGKTFVLLDMAAAVSAGLNWHGRQTIEGSIAYLSFEGDALGLRLRALRDVGGHKIENLYIIRASEPISPRVTRDGEERSVGEHVATEALDALVRELETAKRPPVRLVVVDTVRASLAGSEDSSEHVSAYLRAVRRLVGAVPGAAAILSHHAGWQDGESNRKRERGSSAWRGNCDATVYLEAGEYDNMAGETQLTLKALKVRDGERPAPLHLIRRRVELAVSDRHGRPQTSCVIESDRRTPESRQAAATAALEAEHRALDLRVLRTIREHSATATSQENIRALVGVRKALVTDSLARLLREGWVSPGGRGKAYQVTDAGLQALGQGANS